MSSVTHAVEGLCQGSCRESTNKISCAQLLHRSVDHAAVMMITILVMSSG
jgi:hypothetical protein